jgi:outer membrane receptor protein involved in Fe transport
LSAFYVYFSGTPWTRTLPVKLNQGTRYILAEESGSRRLPATNNLDLRIEKSFSFRNYKLSLMLDIFNVFNRVRETVVYARVGSNFGKPTGVYPPRSFRAGFKLFF